MTDAVSTKGVMLGVRLNDVVQYFNEVKSVPEVGESADKIDATHLTSEIKEYVKDIPDYSSDLEFTMNANPTGAAGSNYDLIQKLSKTETYEWTILYPQLGVKVVLKGEWTWRMGGAEVSAIQDAILTIIPKSAPTWSKISGTYTVTYESNGGAGEMTDESSPYANGSTVTVAECGFTHTTKTFSNWNTREDNTGVSYDPEDTFKIYADTTLYAIWGD